VCSDHGFAAIRPGSSTSTRGLRDNGYLTLKPGAEKKTRRPTTDIDWKKTLAYGIGFNGLYLNRAGREGEGIVDPGEGEGDRWRGSDAISRRSRTPRPGKRPVARRVYRRGEGTRETYVDDMAELRFGGVTRPDTGVRPRRVLGAIGKRRTLDT